MVPLTQRCLASFLDPWQAFEPRPISQLHEVRAAWARLQHLQALPEGAQERAALPAAAAALLAWLRLQATMVPLLMALAGKAVLAGCSTAGMLLSLTGRSAGAAAAGSSAAAAAANAAEALVVSLMAPEDVAEAGRALAVAVVQCSAPAAVMHLLAAMLDRSQQVRRGDAVVAGWSCEWVHWDGLEGWQACCRCCK